MSLIPQRGILAIAAVVDVALHATTRPLSAKTLAARYQLAPRHLEPLLQTLVHLGILKGVRGPRGGYELGRDAAEITADQILQGALSLQSSGQTHFEPGPLINKIVIPAIEAAETSLASALHGITVESLVQCAVTQGLSPA